jgi:beta-phosphoglucomutase-like phosphatase (HAD superfamily)
VHAQSRHCFSISMESLSTPKCLRSNPGRRSTGSSAKHCRSTPGLPLGTVGGFDPVAHLEALSNQRIDNPEKLVSRRWNRKLELLEGATLRPGLGDFLERGVELGLKLAIVSSDKDEWIASNLARVGRSEGWDHINCCNGDKSRAKPLPCLYEESLAALELRPEEAIAFEDSPNGIEAAKAAGIFCCVVPNPVTEKLDLSGGDFYLESFEDASLDDVLRAADAAP